MKKILLLIAVSLCFFACSEKDDGKKQKEWTILIYMAADNNLTQRAIDDINQIEESSYNLNNINVVVQADFKDDNAYRYLISNNDFSKEIVSKKISNLGDINSGDYNSIKSFINFGKSQYPAKKTMLVLWSHGNGWRNKNIHFFPDNTSSSYINIFNGELKKALGNYKFDILAFDACSMQTAEVLSICKNNANYIVASEEEVPTKGFCYNTMLNKLNKTTTPKDFSIIVADTFYRSYLTGETQNYFGDHIKLTISTVDTQKFNIFEQNFINFCKKYKGIAGNDVFKQSTKNLYKLNSVVFDSELNTDLRQFLYNLKQISNNDLNLDVSTVLTKLEDSFLYTNHINIASNDVDYCTIWLPTKSDNFNAYKNLYKNLNFANNEWLNFLSVFLGE